MAAQNPKKSQAENQQGEQDQSEALKNAILKLQKSGMLTHIPDDLADIAAELSIPDDDSDSIPEADNQANSSVESQSDDKTIANRPTKEMSEVGTAADDSDQQSSEVSQVDSVLSAWDEVESQPEPDEHASVTIPSRSTDSDTASQIDNVEWQLPDTQQDVPQPHEQAITLRRKEIKPHSEDALTESREHTPWTLQQFFDGEINLEQELLKRFPTVPAMTTIKFRTLGTHSGRKVATLSTQDGSASLIIDADVDTKVVQMSFTYGSMMTLRYVLSDLPTNNRERWLELMRRDKGGLAFLWNEDRWREDYLICISRDYSTNIFAFSPHNFESAIRMTKNVTEELLNWLEEIWNTDTTPNDDDESPLLTW